jgi:hypothetical protein
MSVQTFPTGIPTSVIIISDSKMNKLQEGPSPLPTPTNSHSFWEFISTCGENWMWNNIDAREYPKEDMKWIAEGMMERSPIWTTDGSCNRKRATDLLGEGWIIFCKTMGRRITRSFWERSSTASSFHTEMLGLCTLHLLA